MGSFQAGEFAGAVGAGEVSLEAALEWHLTSNHYPPIPLSFVPVCVRAIKLANQGKWDANVKLPAGISYKGLKVAPVSEIVEQHHLDSFLNQEEI